MLQVILKYNNLKGVKMKKLILFITSILLLGAVSYADCTYGEKTYSEGAIRGPYICIDGEWIQR